MGAYRAIYPGGNDWIAYTPGVTGFAVGNGSIVGRFWSQNKTIVFRVYFQAGSTTTYSGSMAVGLPAVSSAIGIQPIFGRGRVPTTEVMLSAGIGPTASVMTLETPTSATNLSLIAMSNTSPNPGTTGAFYFAGTYERA